MNGNDKTEIDTTTTYTIENNLTKLECGPVPNVMAALPVQCRSLADAHY